MTFESDDGIDEQAWDDAMVGFKVGDEVEWTSQSAGTTKTKRGVVEALVPAGEIPIRRGKGMKQSRREDSYTVRVAGRLYWPRVRNLRRAK